MPFAGELLQVRDDERDWEGAAERLLRSFGLSLLVPDAHYAAVADWVDRTQLQGPAGVLPGAGRQKPARRAARRCIPIRWRASSPSSPIRRFYAWLERELAHRFDLACCATQDQFRRETRAITRAGQIKGAGETPREGRPPPHRRPQPLRAGLEQQAKIAALEAKAALLEARLADVAGQHRRLAANSARPWRSGWRPRPSWRNTATSSELDWRQRDRSWPRWKTNGAAGGGLRRADPADQRLGELLALNKAQRPPSSARRRKPGATC